MLIYNRTGADAAEKTMTYQENRLIGVSSSGSGASGSGSYDAIGRVVSSDIEGKTKVQYNVTGFPSYIGQADGGYVHSTYAGGVRLASRRTAADGRKLRLGRMVTEVGEMPFENPTDYVGNLVYKNGVLDKILVDGGYISGSDMNYRFFVTDHLGNVRVVVTAAGAIEQENEFYPYGESVDTGTQFTSDNPYKWGGKEWDENLGAYDFGARMYAPADARWSTMDPLCEKYYHISPYSYCAGNPVNLVDPDGRHIRAMGFDAIQVFLNMLSDEEMQYVRFTDDGMLNNDLINTYSGDSILLCTIQKLSNSDVVYDFRISDNDGEEFFFDKDNNINPGSYYYGVTRYPGATNKSSWDKNVHVFTASFLSNEKKSENLGHELLGHGYYYELSRKDPSVKPTHAYKMISGPEILDVETGLMLSPAIRVSDENASIEKWIKRVEMTIRSNYERRNKR